MKNLQIKSQYLNKYLVFTHARWRSTFWCNLCNPIDLEQIKVKNYRKYFQIIITLKNKTKLGKVKGKLSREKYYQIGKESVLKMC